MAVLLARKAIIENIDTGQAVRFNRLIGRLQRKPFCSRPIKRGSSFYPSGVMKIGSGDGVGSGVGMGVAVGKKSKLSDIKTKLVCPG